MRWMQEVTSRTGRTLQCEAEGDDIVQDELEKDHA